MKLGVWVLVAAINSDIRAPARRGPLFHLPPTIKGTAGLFKGKANGHKRSSGAQYTSGGDDKTFSGSVFLRVSSQQTGRRDKVIGSGGQTADLSPHSCAVIFCAVCSVRPPHTGGPLCHAETIITSTEEPCLREPSAAKRRPSENNRAVWRNYLFLCTSLLVHISFLAQSFQLF